MGCARGRAAVQTLEATMTEGEKMLSAQRRVVEAAVAFAKARTEERAAWRRARTYQHDCNGSALEAVRAYTHCERELGERVAELLAAVESLGG